MTVTGTVPDMRPHLRRASVAAVPLVYGVGCQNKVLEAMACATPVVATPRAVAALQVQAGRNVLIADGPQAFADAVVGLLENPQVQRDRQGDDQRPQRPDPDEHRIPDLQPQRPVREQHQQHRPAGQPGQVDRPELGIAEQAAERPALPPDRVLELRQPGQPVDEAEMQLDQPQAEVRRHRGPRRPVPRRSRQRPGDARPLHLGPGRPPAREEAVKRRVPSGLTSDTFRRDIDIPPAARLIAAIIKCTIEDMASERASVRKQARAYLDGEMLDYHCGLVGLDAGYIRRKAE